MNVCSKILYKLIRSMFNPKHIFIMIESICMKTEDGDEIVILCWYLPLDKTYNKSYNLCLDGRWIEWRGKKMLLNIQSIEQLNFERIKTKLVVISSRARKNPNTAVNQFTLNYIYTMSTMRPAFCCINEIYKF